MRTVFLLLSLMLFALLALDFSHKDNSPSSQFASNRGSLASDSQEAAEDSIEESEEAAPSTAPLSHSASSIEEIPSAPSVDEPEPKPEPEPAQTPTPAPIPATTPIQNSSDTSIAAQIEADVLRLSNIERTKIGLNALTLDETLASVARAHSKDMIVRDFFDHNNPDGCSSSCRATAGGYRWKMVGENIHMMSGWQLDPLEAAVMIVQGWMSSPGHKENLLKPGYMESGVGIIVEGDTVYSTGMYGTER